MYCVEINFFFLTRKINNKLKLYKILRVYYYRIKLNIIENAFSKKIILFGFTRPMIVIGLTLNDFNENLISINHPLYPSGRHFKI